jgi:transcriptional regulator with XRE-family HTH domain
MSNYNLKQEIKKLGMTQKGFAELTGLSENGISQWIRGTREMPSWVKPFLEFYRKSKTLDLLLDELEKLDK